MFYINRINETVSEFIEIYCHFLPQNSLFLNLNSLLIYLKSAHTPKTSLYRDRFV